MKQKVSFPLVIVFLILSSILLIVVVSQYSFIPWMRISLSGSTEQESKELSEDETAGWETYRNEEYGFEIKYPETWDAYNESPNFVASFRFQKKIIISIDFFPSASSSSDADGAVSGSGVTYCGAYPEDRIRCETYCEVHPEDKSYCKEIIIDNKKYILQEGTGTWIPISSGGELFIGLVRYGSTIYKELNLSLEESQTIFRKMLSTFKFTE